MGGSAGECATWNRDMWFYLDNNSFSVSRPPCSDQRFKTAQKKPTQPLQNWSAHDKAADCFWLAYCLVLEHGEITATVTNRGVQDEDQRMHYGLRCLNHQLTLEFNRTFPKSACSCDTCWNSNESNQHICRWGWGWERKVRWHDTRITRTFSLHRTDDRPSCRRGLAWWLGALDWTVTMQWDFDWHDRHPANYLAEKETKLCRQKKKRRNSLSMPVLYKWENKVHMHIDATFIVRLPYVYTLGNMIYSVIRQET